MNVKKFLSDNGLKQKDLVNYLGISKPFASQITNGSAKLGTDNLTKLISNPYGWDTSALTESKDVTISANAHSSGRNTVSVNIGREKENAVLLKEIEMLRAQLEEEKKRSAQYWEMIQKLMK